jgi:hypothetical protein
MGVNRIFFAIKSVNTFKKVTTQHMIKQADTDDIGMKYLNIQLSLDLDLDTSRTITLHWPINQNRV